jgi:hypothetical protein
VTGEGDGRKRVHLVHAGQGQLPMKLRAFPDFEPQCLQARLRTGLSSGRNERVTPQQD